MPYKSKAQQRAMHAKADRGEISQKTVHEFDEATKGHYQDLPEHVKKHAAELVKAAMYEGTQPGQAAPAQPMGLAGQMMPTPPPATTAPTIAPPAQLNYKPPKDQSTPSAPGVTNY